MMFINRLIVAVGILSMAGCRGGMYVDVINPLSEDRLPEMVELDFEQVRTELGLNSGETFVIMDTHNEEVPHQLTYDGKVIFPVTIDSSGKETFLICKGIPSEYTVKAYGNHYPARVDDICWENDKVGFRVYGFKGDNPSGYDLFTKKNTDLPVIPEMYRTALDPKQKEIENQIREEFGKDSAAVFHNRRSFHIDHGFGADVYAVGPTLGAGVAALMDGEEIIYPYCYDSFEILDNGPLRFTMKLTFRPFNIGGYRNVTETRIMTIDVGSHFTKTEVSYDGIDTIMPIVAGIVVQDKDGAAVAEADKGYIAYPAPTLNFDRQRVVDNGTIYVGHVYPISLESAGLRYFSDQESSERGGAKGHVLAHSTYSPSEPFTYWWGFGWNHADIEDYKEWVKHLEIFAVQVRNPLSITIR